MALVLSLINGKDMLAVVGGHDGRTKLVSVEIYNAPTGKWETSIFKTIGAKSGFSFFTVKLGDILSKLQ